MGIRLLAMLAMAMMAAGCGVLEGRSPGDATVVEVEAFKLTDAKVVALAGAGGGKAVVLADESSSAEIALPALKKGTYELLVYGFAPSYEEDAVLVSVGDQAYERLVLPDINKLLPAGPLTFTLAKDGACKVEISYTEDNVQLDRIEITPAKQE